MKRCAWAKSEISQEYHDHIWCKVNHDETQLFKMLILEGMQAGLSWETILKKEIYYEKAFDCFDYHKIASYDHQKIESLYSFEGIIHNKNKINSIVSNAKCFIEIQKSYGSFDAYIWGFTNNQQIKHHYQKSSDVPASDALSEKISADLKKKGFKYVGPIIIYSYMQAIGMYNDHEVDCAFYY